MGRPAAAALALLALAAVAGCGSGSGVEEGASVHVYVGSELCPEAREPLVAAKGKAGEVDVRLVCLRAVTGAGEGAGRINLATQGANARRASEDSAAVAFLEAPGKPAEFARPIVEGARIAFVEAADGAVGMERVLRAIEEAGTSGSPREKVRDGLE